MIGAAVVPCEAARDARGPGAYVSEALWVFAGQALVMLGTLVTLKVLTAHLPASLFGRLNLLTTAIILPNWLFLAPISQAAFRSYASYREKGQLGTLLWTTVLAYACVTALLAAAAFASTWLGLPDVTGYTSLELALAVLLFACEAWTTLALGISSAARLRTRVALTGAMGAWSRALCLFLVFQMFRPSVTSALVSLALASFVSLVLALAPLMRELRARPAAAFSGDLLRAMLRYGLPFAVWSVFAWLQSYVDRYVVGLALGGLVLGAYVAALQVATFPFNAAGNLFAQFVSPIVYERAGTGRDRQRLHGADRLLLQVLAGFVGGGLVVVAAYGVAGRQLMALLTHRDYLVPAGVLVILALGALLTTAAQQLTLLLLARNRSASLMACKIVPAIIGAPLVYLLAERLALVGAAVGYAALGGAFLFVVTGTLVRSRAKPVRSFAVEAP